MLQQPKIFISYRRVDEPDFVGRMRDNFVFRYGEENVFMDVDSTPDFTHFQEHIINEVDKSDVLVIIIGPKWLELLKERSRTDEPDYLVKEIERALEKDIMIAPICIKNALVPKKEDLPSGIQKMSDCQIPSVRAEGDFSDDIKKRMDCIEQELEKCGYRFDRTTELDEILNQPLEKLENDIFELLEAGNELRIEKYLREFPNYFLDKVSEIEEPQDSIDTLTGKIIIFGIVFIKYDKLRLYQKFLRTLQLVFEGAYNRFSAQHYEHSDKTRWIWSELLSKLYLLGAILMQENKYEWLSDFVEHPVSWEQGSHKRMYWMWYKINEFGIDNAFLTRIIDIIKENSYFYQQFSNEEKKITNCICQFDFIHCVYEQINIGVDGSYTVYPFFARYYRDRTVPIIQRIIKDIQFRDMLFGRQLDDQKLAEIIRRLIRLAINEFHNWHGQWNDSLPSEIVSFLEEHLPSDVFKNSRFYL